MSVSDAQPTGSEREQIEGDIERLKLALEADGEKDELDSDDDNVQQLENEEDDFVPQPGPSFASTVKVEEEDEDPDALEIVTEDFEELPINAATCLAFNRTYQEMVLVTLRRIEVALTENRTKQRELEESLADNNSSSKGPGKSQLKKRKALVAFGAPYFKDRDGQTAPPNEDVSIKQMMKEEKQDTSPPMPWSSEQRNILLKAIRQDTLRKKLMPLMSRKEIYVEKLEASKADMLNISLERAKLQPSVDNDEEDEYDDTKEELEKLQEKEAEKLAEIQDLEEKIKIVDESINNMKETPSADLLAMVDYDSVDWLKISNMTLEGKREVSECQMMWKNVLHPGINKEPWTTEEMYKLQQLAKKYNMKNWPAIAKELGTNRTPFQCLQYYQKNLSNTYEKRAWTPVEDEMLYEVVENCQVGGRISWNQVSYFMDERTAQHCHMRWQQINPKVKRGKWDTTEDTLLMTAVRLHGTKDWRTVQSYLPNRTTVQCRERYMCALDPNLKAPNMWTYEEDKLLIQLVAQELEINEGKVRWVHVANQMNGRTDNMVYIRYKRLMNWKEKFEWAERQPEEAQRAMGLVSLHTREGVDITELTKTNRALNLVESETGVKKGDYLKRLEDIQRGETPVPRPPLSFRYSTRNFKAIWDRKRQLHNLIEEHLSKTLTGNTITPEARQQIPKDMAVKLWPFSKLSSQLKGKVAKMIGDKNPSQVSVAELLRYSRRVGGGQRRVEARLKKFKVDGEIESKMKDVIFWKMYHHLIPRNYVGRPKKYYIFSPTGRKTDWEDDEDVDQLTSITTTLLMNALQVDAKKALQSYEKKSDKNNPEYKDDVELLRKFTPLSGSSKQHAIAPVVSSSVILGSGVKNKTNNSQGPSSPAPISSSSVVSSSGLKNQTNNSRGPSSAAPIASSSVILGSGLKNQTNNSQGQSSANSALGRLQNTSSNSVGNNSSNVIKTISSEAQVTSKQVLMAKQTPQPKKVFTVPPGARIIRLPPGQQLRPGMVIPLTSATQVTPLVRQVRPLGPTIATPNKPPNKPQEKSQHKNVVVKKKTDKAKPSYIKMLPPSNTNTKAFQGLLLQWRLLIDRAGSFYHKKYYRQSSKALQKKVDETKTWKKEGGDPPTETIDLDNVIKDTEETTMAVKPIQRTGKKTKNVNKESVDKLEALRGTASFKLLRERFQAVFTWPALLSTIPPPPKRNDEPHPNKTDKLPQKKTNEVVPPRQRGRKRKSAASEDGNVDTGNTGDSDENVDDGECAGQMSSENIAMETEEASGPATSVDVVPKKKRKKIRFALVNGKSIYKRAIRARELKERQRKRRKEIAVSIQSQRIRSKLLKIPSKTTIKKMEVTERKMAKYAHVPRRTSRRIEEKLTNREMESVAEEKCPIVKQTRVRHTKLEVIARRKEQESTQFADATIKIEREEYEEGSNVGYNIVLGNNNEARVPPLNPDTAAGIVNVTTNNSDDSVAVSLLPHVAESKIADSGASNLPPVIFALPVGKYDEETGNVEIDMVMPDMAILSEDGPKPVAMIRNQAFQEDEHKETVGQEDEKGEH